MYNISLHPNDPSLTTDFADRTERRACKTKTLGKEVANKNLKKKKNSNVIPKHGKHNVFKLLVAIIK